MSFDQSNLDRLRELKRKLPTKISPVIDSSNNHKITNNLEGEKLTENKNSEELFLEFMESSPDGNIPPHLMSELKKAESIESQKEDDQRHIESLILDKNDSNKNYPFINKTKKLINNNKNLYSAFERLLLEEEEL